MQRLHEIPQETKLDVKRRKKHLIHVHQRILLEAEFARNKSASRPPSLSACNAGIQLDYLPEILNRQNPPLKELSLTMISTSLILKYSVSVQQICFWADKVCSYMKLVSSDKLIEYWLRIQCSNGVCTEKHLWLPFYFPDYRSKILWHGISYHDNELNFQSC